VIRIGEPPGNRTVGGEGPDQAGGVALELDLKASGTRGVAL
jgi:hypothetical protein